MRAEYPRPRVISGIESSRERFVRGGVQVLALVSAQEEAWPFKEPVSAEEVPDYYTLVKVRRPPAPSPQRLRPALAGL